MKNLFIEGTRSGYVPDDCGETMTIGELRQALNNAVEWHELSDDMPIYLCNDRGYTYGELKSRVWIGAEYAVAEEYDLNSYGYSDEDD